MQSTDTNRPGGERLATHTIGDPTKPRLILVHGFTQNSWSWRAITEQLADGYAVTTVDLPGHGGSIEVEATDLEDTARLLGEAGGKGTYIGYSLGGRVTLALACTHPAFIEALVLVSASPGIDDGPTRARRRLLDEALADRLSPADGSPSSLTLDTFLTEWFAHPLFAHLDPIAQDRQTRLQNRPEGLAHSLRSAGSGAMRPLTRQLPTLAMPVLCVAGALDPRFAAIARGMAEKIGENASWEVVPDVGHSVPFEDPATFTALIRRFLEQRFP